MLQSSGTPKTYVKMCIRDRDELPREVLAPAFNELAGQLEAEKAAADIGACLLYTSRCV